MEKEVLQWLSWVKRGRQRKVVLQVLNQPKIPTEIHQEGKKLNAKLSINNCSDILRELEKNGLVKCLNPKEKTGRLYECTLLGNKIRKLL